MVKLYEAWHAAEPDSDPDVHREDYDAEAAQWRAKLGEEAEIKGNKAARQQGNQSSTAPSHGGGGTDESATTRPSLPAAAQQSTR
jgi:hypothetical protein